MPKPEVSRRHTYAVPGLLRTLAPIPGMVWLITALWASLLIGASLVWPMSYGYSEPAHIDMAYAYSADPLHFYGPGRLLPAQATVRMQQQVPGYPPKKSLAEAPIPFRGDRPSFAQLGGHAATHGTPPDQMVQHPPLYYWTEAVVLRVPGVSHLPWDKQVWLMRLLSVLFMLPIPILAWATARRVLTHHPHPHAAHLAVLAAVIPLTIPNLIRVGSSVTNESLLILSTSVVLYLASRAMTGDLSKRTGSWLGLALGVALLTKGSALVLPPIALIAYLLGAASRDGGMRANRRALALALVAPTVGCLIGGAWWLRNLVNYGRVQVDGFGSVYERNLFGPPTNNGRVDNFVPKFLDFFTRRVWGGIGLPDNPALTPFLVYGWLALVMIGVLTCIFLRTSRGSQVRTLALAAAPVLTMVGLLVSSYPGVPQVARHSARSTGLPGSLRVSPHRDCLGSCVCRPVTSPPAGGAAMARSHHTCRRGTDECDRVAVCSGFLVRTSGRVFGARIRGHLAQPVPMVASTQADDRILGLRPARRAEHHRGHRRRTAGAP